MLIAKVENNQVLDVADYQSMFPDTSFGANGPDAQFMAENSCLYVTVWLPYDAARQKLVAVAPYIQDGQVFTVQVAEKTQEELDADAVNATAANMAARSAAYVSESDPIFFKSQRGEATHQEWLDKIAEIQATYPPVLPLIATPAPAPAEVVIEPVFSDTLTSFDSISGA